MSDFRCEWLALHGPRCSHQCNECKDNDTPPEPRMTSERQDVNRQCLAESLQTLAHAIDESYAPDVLASMNEAYRHLTIAMTLYDNPLRATPRAETDETREAVANAVLEAETKWRDKLAADAHQSVRTLGERLTELLDDDHWNNVEPLLLAVAAALAAHPPRAGEVTEEGMADAMMAFNGWDRDEDVTPETRAKLRAHYTGNGIGKRDAMYVAVQRAVTAALGRPS